MDKPSKWKKGNIIETESGRDQRVEAALDHAFEPTLTHDDHSMNAEHYWDAILTYSIKRASQSAGRLSKRVFWLNAILIIIGLLSLLIAGYAVFIK